MNIDALYRRLPFTISNGTSLSGVIDLWGIVLCGIETAAGWTAADLTFQACTVPDTIGGSYNNMFDQYGNELTIKAAASRVITIDPVLFMAARGLKVRSGSSGTPVNQGADRNMFAIVRSIS